MHLSLVGNCGTNRNQPPAPSFSLRPYRARELLSPNSGLVLLHLRTALL